jgi:hypothetical protein
MRPEEDLRPTASAGGRANNQARQGNLTAFFVFLWLLAEKMYGSAAYHL